MRDFSLNGLRLDSVETVANWDFIGTYTVTHPERAGRKVSQPPTVDKIRIHHELERTSALIENLMTLARADSGNEPLQVAPPNLNEVLLEISEPASLLAEGKSIQYDQRLPMAPWEGVATGASVRARRAR